MCCHSNETNDTPTAGPLETEQKGLMKKVQKSQARVESLEKALGVVEQEVAEMRKRFDKRTTEASRLGIELDQATETINAAENLVGKLVGEHSRWSEQVLIFLYSKELCQANDLTAVLSFPSRIGPGQCSNRKYFIVVSELQTELEQLPLLSQLAASFLTYLGGSPEDIRAEHVKSWSSQVRSLS
eukprot:sb/3471398/